MDAKFAPITRIRGLLADLRASFWFVPTLMLLGCGVLALALIEAQQFETRAWLERWPRLFGVSADGARGILSTVAGSMMTVVGVAFSMTLVTLALASSQYTSRILRNFMRDRITQVTLGAFAGIFVYCLIVLRTIRSTESAEFVPRIAVSVSVLLAIGGIGILIFFIHRIASSIQASSIIASVATETIAAVHSLFPEELGESSEGLREQPVEDLLGDRQWHCSTATSDGYIQDVNVEYILRLASQTRSIVRMERGIGQFVVKGTALFSVALENEPDAKLVASLHDAYSISRHRTLQRDCAFGIRQLVDIALRALSPGVNDTTTAIMCIDYLSAILSRLATRSIPSDHRFVDGELRLLAKGDSFESLVSASFQQVCSSAGGNVAVMVRVLGSLQTIGSLTSDITRKDILRHQVQCVAELGERTLAAPHELGRLEARLNEIRKALSTGPTLSAETTQRANS